MYMGDVYFMDNFALITKQKHLNATSVCNYNNVS